MDELRWELACVGPDTLEAARGVAEVKPTIAQGDIVAVNFNNSQYTLVSRGRVRHVPVATGDSWIVLDLNNGIVHYISEGCTVTKLEDGK